MKVFRIIWDVLCVLVALLIGMQVIPRVILNFADIDRHSGIFRNAIIMATLQGVGLVLLIWAGCFCLSSRRWRRVGTADRVILALLGLVFLLGTVASAITSHQYIDHIHWYNLSLFIATFLALAGPAIFLGYGHLALFENIRNKRWAETIKRSPIGSKLLSLYGIIFAGILPLIAAIFLIAKTGAYLAFIAIPLTLAIIYFGLQVFAGRKTSIKPFAILVILYYLGVSYTNFSNRDNYPEGSHAAKMTTPRAVRGVLFAGVFAWYYLVRSRTREQFQD